MKSRLVVLAPPVHMVARFWPHALGVFFSNGLLPELSLGLAVDRAVEAECQERLIKTIT